MRTLLAVLLLAVMGPACVTTRASAARALGCSELQIAPLKVEPAADQLPITTYGGCGKIVRCHQGTRPPTPIILGWPGGFGWPGSFGWPHSDAADVANGIVGIIMLPIMIAALVAAVSPPPDECF